jgi:NAD(P)-dependent dehydrogenase (short-subunit alcohol dehydrogenase family)
MLLLEPGWVETPMTDTIKPELKLSIIRAIPMGRMATSQEIAQIACSMLKWPVAAAGAIVEASGGA